MPTASPFGIPALFRKAGPLKNSSAHTPPHHTAQPLPMSFSDPGKSKLGAVASNASSRPAAKRKPPSRDSPLSQLAYGPNFPARPHICKPSMPPTPSSLLPPGTKSPRKSALCCASCRERIREKKSNNGFICSTGRVFAFSISNPRSPPASSNAPFPRNRETQEPPAKIPPHRKRPRLARQTPTLNTYQPDYLKFCHQIGLNYVSCSPFSVPVARLAAAQAALEETK